MNTEKRKYKCDGCGSARPCFVETNQVPSIISMPIEDLKCVLDETNQSYEWVEVVYETTTPWQRIENAPTEGTEIIGKCANGDVHVVYGHFYGNGSEFEWAQFDGENDYELIEWMPIP